MADKAYKVAFILNARNKAALVGRAVQGALAQTYPCHILLSDQHSTDGTYEAMEKAVSEATLPPVALHKVELLRCPVEGAYGMRAANQHMKWLVEQTPDTVEWIFQCSADDYSLSERVRLCMQAVAKAQCDAVGNTMRFEYPGKPENGAVSGYPTESGYVSAGHGIHKLAFGSCIWGYRRDFLMKVDCDVPCTPDVYLGCLAALGKGAYIVASPQHVHYMAEDMENMGFQGKMRAAEASGDKEAMARINELNRFQLFELYYLIKARQQQLFPLAHADDQNAIINMMLQQSVGWYNERANLHKHGYKPGTL